MHADDLAYTIARELERSVALGGNVSIPTGDKGAAFEAAILAVARLHSRGRPVAFVSESTMDTLDVRSILLSAGWRDSQRAVTGGGGFAAEHPRGLSADEGPEPPVPTVGRIRHVPLGYEVVCVVRPGNASTELAVSAATSRRQVVLVGALPRWVGMVARPWVGVIPRGARNE